MESGMSQLIAKLSPQGIKEQVETFIAGMKAQAEASAAAQTRMEAKLDAIAAALDKLVFTILSAVAEAPTSSTTPILDNGRSSGVLLTSEKFPQEILNDQGWEARRDE